jgi:REP element-mobilizing transposase RayT
MAGTYSQLYIHVVFAVKGRENLLQKQWRDEIFKYMSGIIHDKNQKSIIVNGVEDHVHLFIGLKPSCCLANLIRDVKSSTTNFINEKRLVKGRFFWQEGYGAFSYSRSQLDQVYQDILNQENHHLKSSFKEEYLGLLRKFEIEYADKYLFDWID